jgi:hypothetical protein
MRRVLKLTELSIFPLFSFTVKGIVWHRHSERAGNQHGLPKPPRHL